MDRLFHKATVPLADSVVMAGNRGNVNSVCHGTALSAAHLGHTFRRDRLPGAFSGGDCGVDRALALLWSARTPLLGRADTLATEFVLVFVEGLCF